MLDARFFFDPHSHVVLQSVKFSVANLYKGGLVLYKSTHKKHLG